MSVMTEKWRALAAATSIALALSVSLAASAVADTPDGSSQYVEGTIIITTDGMSLSDGVVVTDYDGSEVESAPSYTPPAFNSSIPGLQPIDPNYPSGVELDAAGKSVVAWKWEDHGGREVVVRKDVKAKIESKHGITSPGPVRVTTQYPRNMTSEKQGTSRVYYADLQWRVCNARGQCPVKASVSMKAVVEFKTVSGGGTYGLVTAYCLNTTLCPSWVNNVA
ncbi:hypothetical protein [Miniimonas sp. S16]|uniref:hypothetical protein n=1 Tax=Miniimonas sp. S16 TaxID=2171623 RepID=UPI00131EE750|nr:hypothetical protein [Miniimonas sp. S16]